MNAGETIDVVVVYQLQEFYMSTQASSDRKSIAVDLLQCQLLSLLGVMPNEQLLVSSYGEIIYSRTKKDVHTIAIATASRPRFFLFSSVGSTQALASDWRQICTKSTFGNAAVIQPAFRKISSGSTDPLDLLICEPCAKTCTTEYQVVSPLESSTSSALSSRFISDITIATGDVDVPAPSGFTKLPVDLNFSASGDYAYLCIKRGGARALTQLHVFWKDHSDDTNFGTESPSSVRGPEYSVTIVNTAPTEVTGSKVCIAYDFVQILGNTKALAITDIAVVAGDQSPPSRAYVMIPHDLNDGALGTVPVYLYYSLSILGGFVCNTGQHHSEFGECLFAARHLTGLDHVFDLMNENLTDAQSILAADRQQRDAKFLDAHHRQHQPSMRQRLQYGLQRAQSYEKKHMQEEALKRIPVENLRERARANAAPMPLFEHELLKQLLHWFKHEFFTWMNQPRCSSCNHEHTRSVRVEKPSTLEEVAGQASRVEVYECPVCETYTRFPRYNDPLKLLATRTGRCGEWANCFTLCCRAMGFEARYVLDVTDHVWTEVYSNHSKRWLHCDACEDQLDCPLTYEVGWGKKLSYIFSFAYDEVVDTARRYTQNWPEMCARRQDVSELWLRTTIMQINNELREQQSPERKRILTNRAKSESEELLRGRVIQKSEIKGRVSGSAGWRSQRKEDGTEMNANLETSRTGTLAHPSLPFEAADLLQQIFKNMVVGCQSSKCFNPYCYSNQTGFRIVEASSDINYRAATAIKLVNDLDSYNFPIESLELWQCSSRSNVLLNVVWSKQPVIYLPLQDSPSKKGSVPLIDISGHGQHVQNSQHCALRKPFRISQTGQAIDTDNDAREDEAYGMQLQGGKFLAITAQTIPRVGGFALSFLIRFDLNEGLLGKNSGIRNILMVRLGSVKSSCSMEFCVNWDQATNVYSYSLKANKTSSSATLPLAFGHYAHIALLRNDDGVVAFLNRTKLEILVANGKLSGQDYDITIQGPPSNVNCVAAVISHVAIIPANSLDEIQAFCAAMHRNFVSAPPLKAFGPNGKCSEARCSDIAAGMQSKYRVARIFIWGHDFFDGIQFVYEKVQESSDTTSTVTTRFGSLVGNSIANNQASQPSKIFELLQDEVISGISGSKGAWIDSLTLRTNFGRTITCGGEGGVGFTVPIPAQTEIRSILFKIGDHLTDICAFILESSLIKTIEGIITVSLT
ncbi:hypothetical protein CCR75_004577 [Bremia lactucae]|uniref:MABP domain-containing protein n=1 Tax=Bremia lactucae TaxID=4779 RepID=A0A976FKL4_BRELC|nr:hypothetical protein CCR75_004577 [Bremia lactucae]